MLSLLACTAVTLDWGRHVAASDTGAEHVGPPVQVGDDGVEEVGGPGDTAPDVEEDPWTRGETLFSPDVIHDFALQVPPSSLSSLSSQPFEYADATLISEGEELDVGIRIKGSSSYDDIYGKPSLKVNVNWLDEGQTFHGYKKFNLHNQTYDPMLMSEDLTLRMFRDAGLPASRSGYAWLTLNGQDYGLYSVIEPHGDQFLARWFDDNDGNLYEDGENSCDFDSCGCFEAEEWDEGTDDALWAMCQAVSAEDASWEEAAREHWDWDQLVGFMAMEAALGHWDSYSYDLSNFRIYHEPTLDRWSMVPSSTDLSFSYRPWSDPDCGDYANDPDGYDMGLLAAKCELSETCQAEFVEGVLAVAEQLEAMDTTATVAAAAERIRELVYADDRKRYSNSDFEEHVACVTAWLDQRPGELRGWAEGYAGE